MNSFSSPVDFLRREIAELRTAVGRLKSADSNGNVVYGGPIKTVHSTSFYTVGPYVRDVDPSFPGEFNFKVPENMLKLQQVMIRLAPKPIRSSVAVTASPSGDLTSDQSSVTTLPDGGGVTSDPSSESSSSSPSATQQVATDNHQHVWLGFQNATPGGYSQRLYADGATRLVDIAVEGAAGGNLVTFEPVSFYDAPTTDHTHPIPHTHGIDDHTHDISHTHEIPTHDHDLTLEIAEGAVSTGLDLWIDGVPRSIELGGPWDVAVEVEITRYFTDPRGRPEVGDHPIKIEVASIGAIEVFIDVFCIAKPFQWEPRIT